MTAAGSAAAALLAGADGTALEARRASQDVFTEEPVPLTVFVQGRGYLNNPPLSEVQYEAVRHAERVFYPETFELLAGSADKEVRNYWSTPCRMVNFLELEWGLPRQRRRQGPHLQDDRDAGLLPAAVPA